MDKLKPIITHRFWILTGLILILAVYGYFSANGAIKAATTARETELSGVISGIPTGQSPNASYSENLKFINTKLESMVEDVIVGLWKKQTERMTWPVVMEGKIPHNFMTTNPGTTFTVESGFVYKSVYENEVLENLMLSVEPVHPLLEQKIIPADRKQKVVLMPDVPRIRLGTMAVKPSDVWDAQIDVWLTSLIFDAIRATNADTDTVSEAVVRRIDKYWLFGGTGTPLLPGVMGAGMMGGYEGAGGYEGTAGDMPGGGYEGAAGAAAGAK